MKGLPLPPPRPSACSGARDTIGIGGLGRCLRSDGSRRSPGGRGSLHLRPEQHVAAGLALDLERAGLGDQIAELGRAIGARVEIRRQASGDMLLRPKTQIPAPQAKAAESPSKAEGEASDDAGVARTTARRAATRRRRH